MIFDLDRQTEGEWFPFFESSINERGEIVYDDPKPNAGRVRIRSLTPIIEQLQAGKKRKYEHVLNSRTGAMERVGYFEDPSVEQAKKERDDVWDYAITGIEGLYDSKGNEIACTRENKLKLMAIPMFDRFVAKCLQILANAGVKAKEDEGKNS